MNCRFCNTKLSFKFIDLNNSPPSNSYLTKEELNEPELFFPLKLYLCDNCFLVQIDEYKKSTDIFNEKYAYFSSYSTTWLNHAKNYVEMIIERLKLSQVSLVVEIASNDGYLLQYFIEKRIPCLGIEPASKTAKVAKEKGISVIEEYFSVNLTKKLLEQYEKPDLIIGNNVLAHVPDINDFVEALSIFLKQDGVISLEFPHLMNLIEKKQFDTIYHEHFSYFSLMTIIKIFQKQNLKIFDVEEIPTHGGSLRIFICHQSNIDIQIKNNVSVILEKELKKGMDTLDYYGNFQEKIDELKYDFLNLLLELNKKGKKIIAYGAAAKGNTLLNYFGIKKDLIRFVVDRSPYKQGKYLPGSHIPIVSEEKIKEIEPDYIVILPWNIKEEIINQLKYTKEWEVKFIIPIPRVLIL